VTSSKKRREDEDTMPLKFLHCTLANARKRKRDALGPALDAANTQRPTF
jgi:hypothetical protein